MQEHACVLTDVVFSIQTLRPRSLLIIIFEKSSVNARMLVQLSSSFNIHLQLIVLILSSHKINMGSFGVLFSSFKCKILKNLTYTSMRNSKRNIPFKFQSNLFTRFAVNALQTYKQTFKHSNIQTNKHSNRQKPIDLKHRLHFVQSIKHMIW